VDQNNQEQFVQRPNQDLHFEIPAEKVEFNYKNGASTGSIILGVGAAGVAIWGAVAIGAAVPAAIIALALTATAGVAQIVSGNAPDPTPETRNASYAEYCAGMRLQQQINNDRASDPNAHPGADDRCGDALFVNAAVAEIDRVEQLYGNSPNRWDNDAYFSQASGTLRCTAKAGRYQKKETWKADEYDKNGYAGLVSMELIKPKNVFYVFNWTYSGTTPPPPTSGS
jgi:hypothetical protein